MKGRIESGFGVKAAAMLAVMVLLSSCSGKQDQPVVKPAEEQGSKKLKVAYFNQQEFNLVYGNALKKLLPDYEFEVIPSVKIENKFSVPVDPDELMKQKPDLIFGLASVQQLSKSGKVMELTPLLKQDNYDLNQLTSAAVEQSRAIGGGRLTNLSPTFNATGLYYNKDMFDRLGIPYPTNRMTWPSLLELAKKAARTENGKQLYGIYTNYLPFSIVQSYAKGVGTDYLSADKRKAMYASDAYVSAISVGVDAFKSNAVYLPPEKQVPATNKKESLLQNKFIAGEAAMSIYNTGLIEMMNDAVAQGIAPIKWDVVTGPVKADKPNEPLFGIVVNDPVKRSGRHRYGLAEQNGRMDLCEDANGTRNGG
ncbi:ABC transporter substrate-binding protein [Paenibacillus ginsengarvi]|uniref:Extracellular solute-binding protein n=1 Tax=Paenibacillus ginsengarvi TaxID=400777 RepID=A0A3B0CKN8_9BACL|nr:extracellular solute-binding protein [Paenibacillus ginsengarvi]RKN84576.1 extracellular solute-binding protein [Paenibacillus ginsengarvi]